ncbi:MAG: hypothetical protein KO202_07575 [Methanobacteriaceae archaeon]|jgi:hypothetical protein|nr:hypothetical protein [Methanobacteriaceae archaeon]
MLSHNNPLSLNISMEEVRTFCNNVNNLKNVFSCDCNRYLRYYSSQEILSCSGPCKNPVRYFKID